MVKRTGDGSIIEFRIAVDAVRCAIEVQNGMVERNAGLPPERRIEFRIGIHLGDVVEESDGKGRAADVKKVGRELGVRYVLEGSVRKSADRVRVTGQLINVSTGAHLWADRFDGTLKDIFDLQDDITLQVVGAIAPKLEHAEIVRAMRSRPKVSTPMTTI